jgi:hypothetical protein
MRLLPTVAKHGRLPVLFATKPERSGIRSIQDVPPFMKAVWDWFGVEEPRLVNGPTLVKDLLVEPQVEQLGGPGPSSQDLDQLDDHVDRRLGPLRRIRAAFVSRVGQVGRVAGERYIEQAMHAAGVTVIRPETLDLTTQLRTYAAADLLIFSEGSAIHGTQLLGRSLRDVAVILRRRWRYASTSLEPRSWSVQYVDAIRGAVTGTLPTGGLDRGRAITVLETQILHAELAHVVPGIEFDDVDYARARDVDVLEWFGRLHPTRAQHPDLTLDSLRSAGLDHLVSEAVPILQARREAR